MKMPADAMASDGGDYTGRGRFDKGIPGSGDLPEGSGWCRIGGMTREMGQNRAGWNYPAVGISLLGAVALQSLVLPCLCYAGTVKCEIALAVDALVALRVIVACLRREGGRGWIFYAALPLVIIPVILLAERFWAPH